MRLYMAGCDHGRRNRIAAELGTSVGPVIDRARPGGFHATLAVGAFAAI
jgi:hypothetical protein